MLRLLSGGTDISPSIHDGCYMEGISFNHFNIGCPTKCRMGLHSQQVLVIKLSS